MTSLFCLFLCFKSYSERLEKCICILMFYKVKYILEELYIAVIRIISRLIIYIDQLNTAYECWVKKKLYFFHFFQASTLCTALSLHCLIFLTRQDRIDSKFNEPRRALTLYKKRYLFFFPISFSKRYFIISRPSDLMHLYTVRQLSEFFE